MKEMKLQIPFWGSLIIANVAIMLDNNMALVWLLFALVIFTTDIILNLLN